MIATAIGIAALGTPYILITSFTDGFKTDDISTSIQRGFVMRWLPVGQVFGALMRPETVPTGIFFTALIVATPGPGIRRMYFVSIYRGHNDSGGWRFCGHKSEQFVSYVIL